METHAIASLQAVIVGGTLLVAGLAKLRARRTVPEETALAVILRSRHLLHSTWIAIALLESIVGAAVITSRGRVAPAAAVLLLAAATAFALWARRAAPERPYGCLGIPSGHVGAWRTSTRAASLTV